MLEACREIRPRRLGKGNWEADNTRTRRHQHRRVVSDTASAARHCASLANKVEALKHELALEKDTVNSLTGTKSRNEAIIMRLRKMVLHSQHEWCGADTAVLYSLSGVFLSLVVFVLSYVRTMGACVRRGERNGPWQHHHPLKQTRSPGTGPATPPLA